MLSVGFKGVVVNTIASEYIGANYETIVKQMGKFGVREEYSADLLNDVYLSIHEKELQGEGYDPDYGTTVEQYVFGTIKQYSKNKTYRGEMGNNNNHVVAASTDNDTENINSFEKALMMASEAESGFEDVDAVAEFKRDINFCLEFQDEISNMNIKSLFENLNMIMEMGKTTLWDRLKEVLREYEDFRIAFTNVLKFATEYPIQYREMLESVGA